MGLVTEMQGCSGRTARDVDEDEAVHTDEEREHRREGRSHGSVRISAHRAGCGDNPEGTRRQEGERGKDFTARKGAARV